MRTHRWLICGALILAACTPGGGEGAINDAPPQPGPDEAAGAPLDEGPGEPTERLEIVGTDDLTFEPSSFTVPAGREVTVVLSAEPAVEHDLNVVDAAAVGESSEAMGGVHEDGMHDSDDMDGMHDADDMDGMHDDVHPDDHGAHGEPGDLHVAHPAAGEEVTETFTITEAGTYVVYCSIAGHREAGMVATLHVVDVD